MYMYCKRRFTWGLFTPGLTTRLRWFDRKGKLQNVKSHKLALPNTSEHFNRSGRLTTRMSDLGEGLRTLVSVLMSSPSVDFRQARRAEMHCGLPPVTNHTAFGPCKRKQCPCVFALGAGGVLELRRTLKPCLHIENMLIVKSCVIFLFTYYVVLFFNPKWMKHL